METKELVERVKKLAEIRKEKEEKKKELAEVQAKHDTLEAELLGILEVEGLKDFNSPYGKITRVEKNSFLTPKTIADKHLLMSYMEEVGGKELLDTYLTFNSASINTWANGLVAQREEQGDLDCSIPGLGTPKKYYNLSFRGAK